MRKKKKARVSATRMRPARDRAADLLELKGFVERGALRAAIDGDYPMAEVAAAHRPVETGHKRGHVILALA